MRGSIIGAGLALGGAGQLPGRRRAAPLRAAGLHRRQGKSVSGETNLEMLLAAMSPRLTEGEYVFCTFANAGYGDFAELEPVAAASEDEGLTLVLPKSKADAKGLNYESVFRRISLSVHSSLDAVGLTAAFSTRLAERGISANVIAGYYHDHIFVQHEHAQAAVEALENLARQTRQKNKRGGR